MRSCTPRQGWVLINTSFIFTKSNTVRKGDQGCVYQAIWLEAGNLLSADPGLVGRAIADEVVLVNDRAALAVLEAQHGRNAPFLRDPDRDARPAKPKIRRGAQHVVDVTGRTLSAETPTAELCWIYPDVLGKHSSWRSSQSVGAQ